LNMRKAIETALLILLLVVTMGCAAFLAIQYMLSHWS